MVPSFFFRAQLPGLVGFLTRRNLKGHPDVLSPVSPLPPVLFSLFIQIVRQFSYRSDFTFVCPTEILAFNDALPDFARLNTTVLGTCTLHLLLPRHLRCD